MASTDVQDFALGACRSTGWAQAHCGTVGRRSPRLANFAALASPFRSSELASRTRHDATPTPSGLPERRPLHGVVGGWRDSDSCASANPCSSTTTATRTRSTRAVRLNGHLATPVPPAHHADDDTCRPSPPPSRPRPSSIQPGYILCSPQWQTWTCVVCPRGRAVAAVKRRAGRTTVAVRRLGRGLIRAGAAFGQDVGLFTGRTAR